MWKRIQSVGTLLVVLQSATLSGCERNRPPSDPIAEACERASVSFGASSGNVLVQKCQCTAAAARKYLDAENAATLDQLAGIYVSNKSDTDKLRAYTVAMRRLGQNPLQASMTAADFLYLGHKAARACGIP